MRFSFICLWLMTFVHHVHVSTGLYLPIRWLITAWVEVLEVYYAAYFSNIFENWFCTCIYATTWSLSNRNVTFASERCLAQRLHRYCELFMNTKPFQSACVCVWFNVKNMSRLSLHLYTHSNTLYVNMNVGHITELLEVHGTRISSPVL